MATIWDADILIWAASQIVEARDRGRPTSQLMATAIDITIRKAAEERLRASEEINRRILASSADCIKVLDREPRPLGAEQLARRLQPCAAA